MKITEADLRRIVREEITEAIGRKDLFPTPGNSEAMKPDPSPMMNWLHTQVPKDKPGVTSFLKDKSKVQSVLQKAKENYPQFSQDDVKKTMVDVLKTSWAKQN